ncbi:UBX domain-containing protein 4 isoform X2 [Amia ocellicauda]|uniref:UBX domain-containing protein 4 isoform X2 n=1 Tax=Amia ocellicauda TaxID=2972642 RepID=UPI0034643E6F
MLWFEGTIPAAIASAKQQNCIFVVVITGDDEQSIQMVSSWEDERVGEATANSFVAIKIDAKSETCVQFSQIYPVVCVPSSFFIGDNGIPLEVIAGSVPAVELVKRIEKVKQMHTQKSTGPYGNEAAGVSVSESATPHSLTPQKSKPQPSPASETARANENTTAPAASKESLSRPTEEGPGSGQVTPAEDMSISPDEGSASSQPDDNINLRVERLTKKLEERREQKKKGEEESPPSPVQNELKKEVERRKLGKEMLDFKKKREGDNTKRMLEERNREKAEEKAARDRVKQQIALDRADRAARYAKTKEEMDAVKAAALQARQAELDARREASQRERSATARIQFRLPDGSSFTNHFPSEARLEEARLFAVQEVGNRYGNFSLATMFPRREFTGEDFDRTLLELELAPSASVVLLPTGRPTNTVVQSSGGGIWSILGTIFYPLLAFWRFISSFLTSSPPAPSSSTSQGAQSQRPHPSASTAEPKRETIRKRVLEKRPEDFKKDGKIYRLRTQGDSEDDNNTWNGNSTQQM